MPPLIVNVRDADPFTYIYVGRPIPGRFRGSEFGNPFAHRGKAKGLIRVATATEAVACYHRWLDGDPEFAAVEPERRTRILDRLPWLRERLAAGSPLGCWCHPAPCHARVLVELCGFDWRKESGEGLLVLFEP